MDIPEHSAGEPSSLDTGLSCLVMIARFHKIASDPQQLRHEFAQSGSHFSVNDVLMSAKHLGLKARKISCGFDRLSRIALPAVATRTDGTFFIIARVDEEKILVHQIEDGRPTILDKESLEEKWSGEVILFASKASLSADLARFDFTWFIPAIVKYRKLLGEILLVSFFLQLFALLTPLFFQVVMDKVLVHHSYTTLNVIAVAFFIVVIFESIMSALRSYIFSHTTSRIDVELGSRLFKHLLALPMSYFQARRVGDSVARVRELENIRNFLTGNALTLILDVLFSFVFIAVMLFYSGWLTLVVLASLPLYVLVSVSITPLLRARLNEKFSRGADNQAFLVESLSAIDTLKSMAVEPQMTRHWNNQLAGYVTSGFRANIVGTIAREGVSLIGKLVTVATLWLGAKLVITGDLSVGQLIAFNMLAGRVSQPIMRLAQLWTDFQQTGISMQRLGDILNAPTEQSAASRTPLPRIVGQLDLDNVVFRYRPDGQEVLRDVSLAIKPGEVIGLVGRSGSGKSTLAKLIQRLYVPERGRVLVDGIDLAQVDPASLRRQIGVVLQENVLLNRSIRENIALSDPGSPLELVINAAKLSGAHEFILELPEGYDTPVGEHGASLSGGQRQRIAIARALLVNPRILIFDEATSALDYESEKIIRDNMRAICKNRTVVIIAHRLSAIRDVDRIIVLDRGKVVEQGTHSELTAHQAGHYARLLRMQQA
jgi:subfamily B ATP-binding cassette protein HlyB/CyaB